MVFYLEFGKTSNKIILLQFYCFLYCKIGVNLPYFTMGWGTILTSSKHYLNVVKF